MELAEKRYAQWLAQQGLEPELRQELDAMHSDAEKITDAFYRDLEFGTAGLRGGVHSSPAGGKRQAHRSGSVWRKIHDDASGMEPLCRFATR